MLEANFWQDKDNSKKVIKEKKLFEDLLNTYKLSIDNLSDLNDLSELALEEKNEPIQKEVLLNIKELRTLVKKMKLNVFYLMRQTLLIVILKYTRVQAALKAKIGQKC